METGTRRLEEESGGCTHLGDLSGVAFLRGQWPLPDLSAPDQSELEQAMTLGSNTLFSHTLFCLLVCLFCF